MIFDFETFERNVRTAYCKCESDVYSVDEVLHVFRYYFTTYENFFGIPHPRIKLEQIAKIIVKMPYILTDDDSQTYFDISVEDYEFLIDQHFLTKYRSGCDYNINHFFSGQIRNLRFYENCY